MGSNSVFDAEKNEWVVNGRWRMVNIHPETECANDDSCIIHNPSDTVYNREDWEYSFRSDGRIERLCEHGVGHADLDQVRFLEKTRGKNAWDVHGCCGCCVEPRPKKEEDE